MIAGDFERLISAIDTARLGLELSFPFTLEPIKCSFEITHDEIEVAIGIEIDSRRPSANTRCDWVGLSYLLGRDDQELSVCAFHRIRLPKSATFLSPKHLKKTSHFGKIVSAV